MGSQEQEGKSGGGVGRGGGVGGGVLFLFFFIKAEPIKRLNAAPSIMGNRASGLLPEKVTPAAASPT